MLQLAQIESGIHDSVRNQHPINYHRVEESAGIPIKIRQIKYKFSRQF